MPPATRREVRLSASLPDPLPANSASQDASASAARSANHLFPNVEYILENFEQFKRKHISQNREIIKTNAMAQLRIRELETRIQILESERADQAQASVGLKAQVNRLEYAMSCVKLGWEAIGHGLSGALSASDAQTPRFEGLGLHMGLMTPEPHILSGSRITLDPSALPAGVVRSVARAPEGHIVNVMEEEDNNYVDSRNRHPASSSTSTSRPDFEQLHQSGDWTSSRQDTPLMMNSGHAFGMTSADSDSELQSLQSHQLDDNEGPPSPMSSPCLPMDLEDVLAVASREGFTGEWRPNPQSFEGGIDVPSIDFGEGSSASSSTAAALEAIRSQADERRKMLRRSGRRSSRRHSGLLSPLMMEDEEESHSEAEREHDIDSSYVNGSSEGTGEESQEGSSFSRSTNQRSTTGPGITSSLMSASTILREVTNRAKHGDKIKVEEVDVKQELVKPTPRKVRRSRAEPELMAKKASIEDLASHQATTPIGVKRKVPAHELEEITPMNRVASPSATSSSASSSSMMPADTDAFGRARRARKSVNYALPKLNTKMRKPDPVDLVPATPGTASGSRSQTPASTGARVGSTGNLHDIRRQHEASASKALNGANESADDSDMPSSGRMHGPDFDDMPSSGRMYGPDDEDGNAEGGSASLADLFETNPRRTRNSLKRAAGSPDGDSLGDLAKDFWKTESETDTSDDESKVMSASDLGELAELEDAMSELSTTGKVGPAERSSALAVTSQITKSGSSSSIVSSSSADGEGVSRRPSLRRSTTLPTRQRVPSSVSAETISMPRSVSSDSVVAKRRPGSDGTDYGSSAEGAASPSLNATPTQASETVRVTKASAPATRRISSTTKLAANMKPKERPSSSGNGASTTARTIASSTASSAGSPLLGSGTGSAGRSSGNPSLQRGNLHAALTNQVRTVTGTPQLGTNGLPAVGSPATRPSPLLVANKALRHSASASSLATSSSGRSSPALSVASTGSSTASHVFVAGRALALSSLARSTVPKAAEASQPQPSRSMPSLKPKTVPRPPWTTNNVTTPRITVRSSASASSLSSEKSNASSNATITYGRSIVLD